MATTEYHSIYEALKELSQKIINEGFGDYYIKMLPMRVIMSLSNDEFGLLQILMWHYMPGTGLPEDGEPYAPQLTAHEILMRNEKNRNFTSNIVFRVDTSHHFMVTSGQIAIAEPVDCAHYEEGNHNCFSLRGTPNGRWNVIHLQWFDKRTSPSQHREHAIICYHEAFDYRRVCTGQESYCDGEFKGQCITGHSTIGVFDQSIYGRTDQLPPEMIAAAQKKFEERHDIPAPEFLWGTILWQTMLPNLHEMLILEQGIVVWAAERRSRCVSYFQRPNHSTDPRGGLKGRAKAARLAHASDSIPLFFISTLWSPFPCIIEERR